MKKIVLICIPLLLFACSPKHNVEFKEYTSLRPEWSKKTVLEYYKAQDSKYSILYFTSGFRGEKVSVINQKDTLYNGKLESGQSLSLAEVLKINNTKPLKVVIDGTVIKLKEKNLSVHKFIYLSKNFNEKYLYTVTYSKTPRNFR